MEFNFSELEGLASSSIDFDTFDKRQYESKVISEKRLIESAMKRNHVSILINELDIESEIEGLTVLNIFGRALAPKKSEIVEADGFDGGFIQSSAYSTRTLKVEFMLRCDNEQELLRQCSKLNDFLNWKKVNVYVPDEKKFYFGTVTEVGEVEENTNTIISYFNIVCPTPYKYSELKSIKIKKSSPSIDYFYQVKQQLNNAILERIIVDDSLLSSDSGAFFKILNEKGQKISAQLDKIMFESVLVIDCQEGSLLLNNQQKNNLILLDSDLENFSINTGGSINVSSFGTTSLYYRERWL